MTTEPEPEKLEDQVFTSDPRTEDYFERGAEPGDDKAVSPERGDGDDAS